MTEHLKFYLEHGVSPVNQDIKNLQRHLERREALYRFLGVSKNFLNEKEIMEVGPGSGQNSLYIASCLPSKLVLVEPNPSGIKQIKENFSCFNLEHTKPEILNNDFLTLPNFYEVDFAIAECFLGKTELGIKLIKKLESIVKKNGVIILTSTPFIGLLATSLRAALAYRLIDKNVLDFSYHTNILLNAFSSHLISLSDMSRSHTDWVQDNLLNPGALVELIHPVELIKTMSNSTLLASNPTIFEGWEWYKSYFGNKKKFEEEWINQYYEKSHNLLDTTTVSGSRDKDENIELEDLCEKANLRIIELREHDGPDEKLISIVRNILNQIPTSHKMVKISIVEWLECYQSNQLNSKNVAELKTFRNWFGRELIYQSFTKN